MKKMLPIIFAFFLTDLLAQEKGAVWGSLKDELSGDAISEAKVELLKNNFIVEDTHSDRFGEFRFYGVNEGTYKVRINVEAYQQVIVEGIRVKSLKNTVLTLSFGKENPAELPLIIHYGDLMTKNKKRKYCSKNRKSKIAEKS